MKARIILAAFALFAVGVSAQAQTTTNNTSAEQQANSAATSYGTLTFSQNPAHTTETVLNVPSQALGAAAAGFSPYNCYGTKGGLSVAVPGGGFIGSVGGEMDGCQLGWLQNDFTRQAAVVDANNEKERARDLQIATNLRCLVSSEAYDAIQAEYETGSRNCHVKPKNYSATQATTRNVDGTEQYVKAQVN